MAIRMTGLSRSISAEFSKPNFGLDVLVVTNEHISGSLEEISFKCSRTHSVSTLISSFYIWIKVFGKFDANEVIRST